MSNFQEQPTNNQEFYGGVSADPAIGPPASFSYSRALDHRSHPSELTVLPGPRTIGRTEGLILKIIQTKSGTRYAIDSKGNIYRIDQTNTLVKTNSYPSGSDGLVYREEDDRVYLATQSDVRCRNDGTVYGPSRSIDTKAYRTGGSSTYTLPTTITEADRCTFQSDIEPFYSIKVNIKNTGNSDWTLTLHDGLNTVLASVTILAINVRTGLNEFVFPVPIRGLVKPNARSYHFHLTKTGTQAAEVAVATAGQLETADFELWADRLIQTTNKFHPMVNFLQYILIGNGNYLAVWEPISPSNPSNDEFQRHRLTFPTGFEVCGITVTDEFAVIACAKYSTDDGRDYQEGKLFIWDGTAKTYNQVVDIAEGAPEGITTHQNYPHYVADGVLSAWPGGKNTVKIRRLTDTSTAYRDVVDITRVYPNMLTVRDGMLHVAFPSHTNDVRTEFGVSIWGSLDKDYPDSFNYAYVPAAMQEQTRDVNGTYEIGCVHNFGDEMYLSWRIGERYGLDIVDAFCDPAPIAQFRARRFDAGAIYKTKKALRTGIFASPLPTGAVITPMYAIDGAAPVIQAEFAMREGTREVAVALEPLPFHSIIYGFDIASTGELPTTVYSNTLVWNPLLAERSINGPS